MRGRGDKEPLIRKVFFPLALFLWVALTLLAWIVPGLVQGEAASPGMGRGAFLERFER